MMTNGTHPSPRSASPVSESVISAEAVWEGKIIAQGDIRVEGTASGEMATTGSLTMAANARVVDATIRAGKIVLAGEFRGHLVCDDRLELLSGSNLSGKVQTRSLVVHEGAYIEVTGLKMTKPSPN
jgi:cytoskeletal protein CcmA (bactofilin family)